MTLLLYAVSLIITLIGCRLYSTFSRSGRLVSYYFGPLGGRTVNYSCFFPVLLIMLPTVALVSLRYGIGGDYFNYQYFYKDFISSGQSQFEPLTEILMLVSDKIFHSYEWFLAVVASITFVLFFSWVIKHAGRDSLAISVGILLCFYFAHSMNTIVQILATSVVIWAYDAIQERKVIRFALIVLVASCIHSSAMIVAPLFFIRCNPAGDKYRNARKSFLKITAIACSGFLAALVYFGFAKRFGWPYSSYIGKFTEGGYISVYLKLGILFYIPEFYFLPRMIEDSEKYELAYIMIFLEILAFTASLFVAYAFRVAYYFSVAHCILIPAIIEKMFAGKSKILVKMYFSAALLFYFYFTTFICEYNNIFEYHSLLMRG